MSLSKYTLTAPGRPQIPRLWVNHPDVEKFSNLCSDITQLLAALTNMTKDMINFTNWGNRGVPELWREFFYNTRWLRDYWLKPLVTHLLFLGSQFTGTWGNLHYVVTQNFRESENNVSTQCSNLRKEFSMLTNAMRNWFLEYPVVFKIANAGNLVTARPSVEILFEALLVSNLHRYNDDPKLLLSNLHQLGKSHKRQRLLSFQTIDGKTPIGFVHCLSALYTRDQLVTGSTLVNWGDALELTEFVSTERTVTLHDRARSLRQGRYLGREQTMLNTIVNREINYCMAEYQRILRQKETTPGVSREAAASSMVETAMSRRAPCIRHNPSNQIGQSYSSKNLFAKRKCPMCMAAYPFNLAIKGSRPDTKVDWEIHEAKRPREVRGCCSEPIVFVQGIRHRNLWPQLEKETRDQHPELKVKSAKTPEQRHKGKGPS